MICGPRRQTSPSSRGPSAAPVARSTILHSVFGNGTPAEPARTPSSGLTWLAQLVSVMPYPCPTWQPIRARHASSTSLPSGAAPEPMVVSFDRSYLSTAGCFASATTIGGTSGAIRDTIVLQRLQELLDLEARQRDDGWRPCRADAEDDRDAVDVVEGQHAHHGTVFAEAGERGRHLDDVRTQAAVGAHHALGEARRPAGIRQRHHVIRD